MTIGRGGFLFGGGTGGGTVADGRRNSPIATAGVARTILHRSQTLTGLPLSIFPITILSLEQLSQTIFPQFRQWCLRKMRENAALHLLHKPDWSSGLHIGATVTCAEKSEPTAGTLCSLEIVLL